MRRWLDSITCFLSILLMLLAVTPAFATALETAQPPASDITPADVFVHVSKVRAELELLRYHMGKPKDNGQALIVSNAAPREVFYQAMTLFDKTNQFSAEQMRVRRTRPDTPDGQIQPRHVFSVVDQALTGVRAIKAQLKITTPIKQPRLDPKRTPTDVFLAIVRANRQLNLLLDQKFAPKHVFRQVSQAIGYTARLLKHFPDTQRIPNAEPLQSGKRPGAVFQRLTHCYELIRSIGVQSNLAMLRLNSDAIDTSNIVPSDVYDIASLLISELAYLHTMLPDALPPRPVFDPGRKFPSHVYQRVGLLEAQLKMLSAEVKRSPYWLSGLSHQARR